MHQKELVKLANYIKDQVDIFVPYSSNNLSLTDQPYHRFFGLVFRELEKILKA